MVDPPQVHPKVLPPFPRVWAGHVDLTPHKSAVLAGNPLGDPTERTVGMYRPPDGATEGRPMVVFLPGFAGIGASSAQPDGFLREDVVGTLDRLVRSGQIPPMSLLLPNCLTALGGSQYVNSPATGRYADYLLDEVIPWAAERLRPSSVGIFGQSSGGFGALHLAMERPGAFGAVGSSAGDMAFDLCFFPDIPKAVRALRELGGPEELLRKIAAEPSRVGPPTAPVSTALLLLAMGACYSPVGTDGSFELPFDLETGELVPKVWERWKRFDPVERLSVPADRAALSRLRSLHLTASRGDEWYLDLAARRFVRKAALLSVPVLHEEFDGGHFDRLPRVEALLRRLGEVLPASRGR